MKKVFYPNTQNNNRPYFWHPISVVMIVLFIVLASGFLLIKDTSDNSLLGDIKTGVIIALTNTERKDEKLPELVENETLNQAALLKAQDMAERGYFAHNTPEGLSPWYWFTKAGYSYKKAGENLAVNFDDSEDVVNAWMNSPTHKANIVKDGYTEIGIGVAEGSYKGRKATFVVQLFATPRDTVTNNAFAFSIEKTPQITDEQTSVQGAEVSVFTLANIFDVFASETYTLIILLLLVSVLIITAIIILFVKGKNHTKQFYISLIVLLISLIISLYTITDFFNEITLSLI